MPIVSHWLQVRQERWACPPSWATTPPTSNSTKRFVSWLIAKLATLWLGPHDIWTHRCSAADCCSSQLAENVLTQKDVCCSANGMRMHESRDRMHLQRWSRMLLAAAVLDSHLLKLLVDLI
jgi:hypothetical protein